MNQWKYGQQYAFERSVLKLKAANFAKGSRKRKVLGRLYVEKIELIEDFACHNFQVHENLTRCKF